MRSVGIMGGTFDPVHNGHLILAENARDAFGLDEVRFMPTAVSYLKSNRSERISEASDRLAMVKLAIEGNPSFTASDLEIRRGGNTYTYETMQALKAAEPDTAFWFLCGGDSIAAMHTWVHPERIFASCGILGAVREDEVSEGTFEEAAERLRKAYGARIRFVPMPSIGISSTDIRERIRGGRSVRYLVPDAVADYIEAQGLYRQNVES